MKRVVILFILILLSNGVYGFERCEESPLDEIRVSLKPFVSGLSRPVYLTHAGGDRLFVVEQEGVVRIIEEGILLKRPFLDIRDRVEWGGEKGLLSIAFHPGYRENGRFFVNYTARKGGRLKTVIAEYRASGGFAIKESERIILEVDQPFSNHNGGLLIFGPDGYLYIGMGDGGSGGDPLGHGQNPSTLLGAILRIDVDRGRPYGIPKDNPAIGRSEIWAYGFRNPWRFSFDRCTGRLFVADVGQDRWEEIDLVLKGGNYGWNIMEGNHCYENKGCRREGLVPPIAEYGHDLGCSVTGGYVYRGKRYPLLRGFYFFGDFCSGRIWALKEVMEGKWKMMEVAKEGINISSFGEDKDGELYVLDYKRGMIYRIVQDGKRGP